MFKTKFKDFSQACDALVESYDDPNYGRACLVGHLQALIDLSVTDEQLDYIIQRLNVAATKVAV